MRVSYVFESRLSAGTIFKPISRIFGILVKNGGILRKCHLVYCRYENGVLAAYI